MLVSLLKDTQQTTELGLKPMHLTTTLFHSNRIFPVVNSYNKLCYTRVLLCYIIKQELLVLTTRSQNQVLITVCYVNIGKLHNMFCFLVNKRQMLDSTSKIPSSENIISLNENFI